MYEQFFGLRERPFDLTPNPRFLVLTESHREALANLEYGIGSRKGITLLVGEAGSGKTTMIRAAVEKMPARVHCVHLHNPTLSRPEFVEMLATRFGLSEEASQSKATMLIELEALLRARRAASETSVLVVDEAQSLPAELLEEIRLLANIETNDEKLLSLIIAGQPELAERLNDQSLRQLKQRIALRCELQPLSAQETAGYIAGRIRAAGGTGAKVFTREAVALIHERALGIPRTISVIADNALVGGLAAGQRPVGSELVREICRDFDLKGAVPVQAHPPSPQAGVQPAAATNGADGMAPSALLDLAQRLRYAPQPTALATEKPAAPGVSTAASAKQKLLSFFRS
ncbi:MAG TPA: AAA family ATPase [Vicinamibacterales bacterium]|nr:AAA family ATPase [Vicinamibacterales bacterium]